MLKCLTKELIELFALVDNSSVCNIYDGDVCSIKLGVIDDHANRTRLSKLLRFKSSNDDEKMTSLADYISRMKDNQEHIFFMAGTSLKEVTQSPFVERLLKKGYEVSILLV